MSSVGKWLADRGIRTKVLAVVGVSCLAAGAVAGTGASGLNAVAEQGRVMYQQDVRALAHLAELQHAGDQNRRLVLRYAQAADDAQREQARAALAEADARVGAAITSYGGAADQARVADLQAQWDLARQIRDEKLLAAAGRPAQFERILTEEAMPAAEKAQAAATTLFEKELSDAAGRISSAEAVRRQAQVRLAGMFAAGLVVSVALALLVSGRILTGVRQMRGALGRVAGGNLRPVRPIDSADEIGQMSLSLAAAVDGMREAIVTITSTADTLSANSSALSVAGGEIRGTAGDTAVQANVIAAAAEEVSGSIRGVAAGADGMSASIREIGDNAAHAARVAGEAVELVETATSTVTQLASSSGEISDVVKVITAVAEQTNLLALNATIEAARAGEAGKGFAVVATEVKQLARETAQATEAIGRRIEAIQADSVAAVEAIARISGVIESVNGYQTVIASAVDEQTATTNAMSRSVAEAAAGSGQIAENVGSVASAAHTTHDGVAAVSGSAAEMAELAADMQRLVKRFTLS